MPQFIKGAEKAAVSAVASFVVTAGAAFILGAGLVAGLVSVALEAAADPARAVSFQGAPGCNGHRAATEYAPDCLPLPCFSFEDALEAVKDGRAGRAIIPIENSQHGRVADIHFLLPESGLAIVGEHFMAIHHDLMALGDGPFKAAYSHPQALGQSRVFLRERGIVPLAYADTAGAAAFVAEQGDPEACAIAPKIAAELYGLKTIAENVEDAADNMTRFVVLSRQPLDPETLTGTVTMTTFVFEVKNIPAALYKAMGGGWLIDPAKEAAPQAERQAAGAHQPVR